MLKRYFKFVAITGLGSILLIAVSYILSHSYTLLRHQRYIVALPQSSSNHVKKSNAQLSTVTDKTQTISSPKEQPAVKPEFHNHNHIMTLKSTMVLNNTTPMSVPQDKKLMAVIVTGVGLNKDLTHSLTTLDKAVTVAFHPYIEDIQAQLQELREHGHELIAMIPMEPMDYPNHDPGPGTLLTGLSPEDNIKRLALHLESLSTVMGVMNDQGTRFTASKHDYEPIVQQLKKRQLLLVDDHGASRSWGRELASKYDVAIVHVNYTLDSGLTVEEILSQLDKIDATTTDQNAVIISCPLYPLAIEALKQWSALLYDRKFVLVPLSAIAQTN